MRSAAENAAGTGVRFPDRAAAVKSVTDPCACAQPLGEILRRRVSAKNSKSEYGFVYRHRHAFGTGAVPP